MLVAPIPAKVDYGSVSHSLQLASGTVVAVSSIGLVRSDDRGRTWTPVPPPPRMARVIGVGADPAGRGVVVAGVTDGSSVNVARSTDLARWRRLRPIPLPVPGGPLDAAVDVLGPRTFMVSAVLPTGSVYYEAILGITTDAGATWRTSRVPGGDIAFRDARHGIVGGGFSATDVETTADGGRTWSLVTVERPPGITSSIERTCAGAAVVRGRFQLTCAWTASTGPGALTVLEVRGSTARTIAGGTLAPGSHSDSGRPLPATYDARRARWLIGVAADRVALQHGDSIRTRRLAVTGRGPLTSLLAGTSGLLLAFGKGSPLGVELRSTDAGRTWTQLPGR
jgi:hypothetical protein